MILLKIQFWITKTKQRITIIYFKIYKKKMASVLVRGLILFHFRVRFITSGIKFFITSGV
jgi:hypothetical protein